MGDVDLEWKKYLTLSTIERVLFGLSALRESGDRLYIEPGVGRGIVSSIGLGRTEFVLEEAAEGPRVRGEGD